MGSGLLRGDDCAGAQVAQEHPIVPVLRILRIDINNVRSLTHDEIELVLKFRGRKLSEHLIVGACRPCGGRICTVRCARRKVLAELVMRSHDAQSPEQRRTAWGNDWNLREETKRKKAISNG